MRLLHVGHALGAKIKRHQVTSCSYDEFKQMKLINVSSQSPKCPSFVSFLKPSAKAHDSGNFALRDVTEGTGTSEANLVTTALDRSCNKLF